jgi:predicted AAA+ superfamily ATPase
MKQAYFSRNIDADLLAWSREGDRKPLLLRGARQVGKSSAVRQLGTHFQYFLEINFDEDKEVHAFFEDNLTPQDLCSRLALYYRTPVNPGETLLFLDEIQTCKAALAKLRYFYERYPELHLIAAGSLLEFVIEEIPSFGVGRIHSLFMYPFRFMEFLRAQGEGMLADAIAETEPAKPLPEPVHKQLISRLKIFLITGGMPEAVAQYIKTGDLLRSEQVLSDLLIAFKDDFAKYRKKIPALLLNEVFESVMNQAEGKFVYERAVPSVPQRPVKQALELLIMAGLAHPVTHTAANGLPLGAEINPKYRRIIPCDTGLFLYLLGSGSPAAHILAADDLALINRGALAEIFTALELLKGAPASVPMQLYFWQRSVNSGKQQSAAQVDFLIHRGNSIIPIEVKAGTRGAMQSLRIFMEEKHLKLGVRTSLENFGIVEDIHIYPLYAISNLVR